MTRPWLSVVIPVYDEKNTIAGVLQRVQAVDIGNEKEIVVVDDGSKDGPEIFLPRSKTRTGTGMVLCSSPERDPSPHRQYPCIFTDQTAAKELH